MKFQRSTIILVGVAFLLGAGVLIAESQRTRAPESATQGESTEPILIFEETDVVTLVVDRGNETLIFEQDNAGNWQMVEPEEALAEPGAIAFLLSRLNTDSPLQTVTMQPDQFTEFGFNAPEGIVTMTLQDGTEHELILGGPDFSGGANYAIVDPDPWPPETGQAASVLVVTRDVANGINRPLEEWKMPLEAQDSEAPENNPVPPDGEPAPADPNRPIEPEGAADSPEPATIDTDNSGATGNDNDPSQPGAAEDSPESDDDASN
ncbi:MAG: DUF4340 domain-containing protein [Cyanobacteria bacterium J06638_6]